MKYIIAFFTLVAIGSIVAGYFLETEHSQKLIGAGVACLFFIVFPLFSYHRWKNKDVKDYMITKENLEKMRKYNEENDN